MSVAANSKNFRANAAAALENGGLRAAVAGSGRTLAAARAAARGALPEFEALRDAARDLKNHTLAHLDLYLERYEAAARAAGATVHWAETAEDANRIILRICRDAAVAKGGKAVVNKGKSMVSEETGLNAALEAAGHRVVETDLGEYIIQLRGEAPSHIIAPAVHVSPEQVAADFRAAHVALDPDRAFPDARSLVREARGVLRDKFFAADVGITGANLLIAETGQSVIVTNEGNGDLTQSLARAHVVIASLEKVVPTLEDAATILRLLARSATGQASTVYTTFSSGPRRPGDPDGPEAYHVVLLDNGRSAMLGEDFAEMLRCIRCGACMNHCPVYRQVGGHAYGWVYPGPMGSVLTPALIGEAEGAKLAEASTFCGRCEAVCPVRIPLPALMRRVRERAFAQRLTPAPTRWALKIWAALARRPRLYRRAMGLAIWSLRRFARGKPVIHRLPLGRGWSAHRDFPTPQGRSFLDQWAAAERRKAKEAGR